jgi:hypothetical protein
LQHLYGNYFENFVMRLVSMIVEILTLCTLKTCNMI